MFNMTLTPPARKDVILVVVLALIGTPVLGYVLSQGWGLAFLWQFFSLFWPTV